MDSTYCVRRIVSGKWLLPPSMMMSPGESSGMSWSIIASTAAPALTIRNTLRGAARLSTSSSTEWQPMMFLPFARPDVNASTFSTVRL